MFPIFGALQIILLLNRMSNAQSSDDLFTLRKLTAGGGPQIHISAHALGLPTLTTEISPPPPTNMPHLPFSPLQSVQTTKPPSMSSLPPALDNHSEDVDSSIKDLSVKDPSVQGPSVKGSSVQGPSVKGSSVKGSSVKGPPVGKPSETDRSANGPAATVSNQTVLLSTEGVIVGDTTHPFSAVSPAVNSFRIPTTGVSLCTVASGKKVTVAGSLTLSAGGKTAKVSDQAISMGAKGVMLGNRTTDFAAFKTTRLKSDNLKINGKSFSSTGIYHLELKGESHTPYASGFSLTSPITGPSATPIILPTIITIRTRKFTADLSGKDLVADTVTASPATTTGNMAHTGRAARAFCNYSGWFVGGIAAWGIIT